MNKLTIAILTGAILSAPLIGISQDRAESRFSMNRSGGVDATGGNTDGNLSGYSSRRFNELATLNAPTIDLSAIEDRITNVQNDLSSTINNLESNMTGQINTVQSQLSNDLNATESNFNSQLSNVQGMVNTNTNSMNSMESNLQGQIDSGVTTMDSLAQRVGTNENGIRDNGDSIRTQSSRVGSALTLANTAQTRADAAYSKAMEALNSGGGSNEVKTASRTIRVSLRKAYEQGSQCWKNACSKSYDRQRFQCTNSVSKSTGTIRTSRNAVADVYGNYQWEAYESSTYRDSYLTCTQKVPV